MQAQLNVVRHVELSTESSIASGLVSGWMELANAVLLTGSGICTAVGLIHPHEDSVQ